MLGYNCFFSIAIALFLSTSAIAQSSLDKFNSLYAELLQDYVEEGSVNYSALSKDLNLAKAMNYLSALSPDDLSKEEGLATHINAYNIAVMHSIAQAYPIKSPQDVSGFFDKQKHLIAGQSLTLNELEDSILKEYSDARLHFVLVCGAIDCPPIVNRPYTAKELDRQLDRQTSLALNNDDFLRTTTEGFSLSRIFKWYKSDFEQHSGSVLNFINAHRETPISEDATISYYSYNWGLNDLALDTSASSNNAFRYVVSSTIRKGGVELKIFNNLYSQTVPQNDGQATNRASFFTTNVSFLYGLGDYFNVGFNGRIRRVQNSTLPSSAFDVLRSTDNGNYRSGLTGIGPQIRWAPVPKWENFSIQSFLTFAPGDDLEGTGDLPFIDWNRATWVTQVFNDFSIGDNFSLFADVSLWYEDIGAVEDAVNRVSTPITLIGSYFPTPKITLYVLGGYSPYWNTSETYFRQLGVGFKYQFTPNYELELLYTDFGNDNLDANNGQAATYNLGFRYNY